MKKNLLAIIAVVAALSLSAFTPSKVAPTKEGNSFTLYHYWIYNPNTGELGTYLGQFDSVTDRDQMISVDCPDEGSEDCIRGYASPFNQSNPPEGAEIESEKQDALVFDPE